MKPNPSLNPRPATAGAVSRSGATSKIVAVPAYSTCLRGRGQLERQASHGVTIEDSRARVKAPIRGIPRVYPDLDRALCDAAAVLAKPDLRLETNARVAMNELLAAYRYVSNNWAQIQGSTMCGCCACVQTFQPEEIVAWTGLDFNDVDNPEAVNNQTALCPRCGSEAVLGNKSGYPIDANFLSRMNEAWFQRTIIRKPTPKK